MNKSKFCYIVFEKGKAGQKDSLWIDGVKKKNLPDWVPFLNYSYEGFIEITENMVVLYNRNWTIRKKILS